MGCPALGVSVAFLKQPALPRLVKRRRQKKSKKIINKKSKKNQK
jgi:hypothetical protein